MRRHRPLLLRQKIILLTVLLSAIAIFVNAVISIGAIKASLYRQVDGELRTVSERMLLPGPPSVESGVFPGDQAEPRDQVTGDGGTQNGSGGNSGVPSERDQGNEAVPSDQTELGIERPGQRIGTLEYHRVNDEVNAAYISADFEVVPLTVEQAEVLRHAEGNGAPQNIDIPGLGSYRVLVSEDSPGDHPGANPASKDSLLGNRASRNVAMVGLPLSSLVATQRLFVAVHLLTGGIALLVVGALGAWLVRRALRPLRDVAETAKAVSEIPLDSGDVVLHERVAYDDPRTEVGAVGAAINAMLGHVENSLSARNESEKLTRQFVADASHELRNPLAAISGYTELIRSHHDFKDPEISHALERISDESERMKDLVEDLLLLARLDAGREIEKIPVDVVLLAVEAIQDAHVAGPDHEWEFEVAPPQKEVSGEDELREDSAGEDAIREDEFQSIIVHADKDRLYQALLNLLTNARVHTPSGTRVKLTVGSDDHSAFLSVADDGPGIDPKIAASVFSRFSRGDQSRSRTSGSTGLGLSIAKSVVEAHGGTLTFQSPTNREHGTVFTIRLPLAEAGNSSLAKK